MNRTTILTTLILLLAVVCCVVNCSSVTKPKSASLVLRFSPQGELLCEVNGKPITVLIDELKNLYRLNGPKMRLNLFFHQDVSIAEIFLMMPVVSRVGFTSVHIYSVNRNKSGMKEINLGKERPFTLEP